MIGADRHAMSTERAVSGGGWIAVVAPAAVPVLLAIEGRPGAGMISAIAPSVVACIIACAVWAGIVLRARFPRLARFLYIAGVMGFGAAGVSGLADTPVTSFGVAVVVVAALAAGPARSGEVEGRGRGWRRRAHLRRSAWAAVAVMLGLAAFVPADVALARVAGVLPAALLLLEARGLWSLVAGRKMAAVIGVIVTATALVVVGLWLLPPLAPAAATIIPIGLLLLVPGPDRRRRTLLEAWSVALMGHPARLLLSTFAVMGVVGGLALTMPAASTGERLPIIDGVFTAVSAVCVTGLAVVDTPGTFTGVGEAIILLLIQVGGLGILTFTTAALLAVGTLDVRSEGIASRLLAAESPRAWLRVALRRVLVVTAITEATGAVILSLAFIGNGEPIASGMWRGTFTAVSAYCNAGFALDSDSLVSYSAQPLVVLMVSALVIVGGLGPAVVVAVPSWIRGRSTSLLVRVVLTTTVVLLVVPAVLMFAIESSHSLAEAPLLDRIVNAWFLSVTTRTAGFNSVDMGALAPATVTLIVMLMAIGGSPGSTAGGLKTTTAAVLLLASVAAARGASHVRAGRRYILDATIHRALAATGAMGMVVAAAVVLLQLTQPIPSSTIVFEVVSAVATVGLSLGATSELDGVGRVVITFVMLIGRVGPLVFLGVLMPVARREVFTRPAEDLPVG